jgi:hypothetical protein
MVDDQKGKAGVARKVAVPRQADSPVESTHLVKEHHASPASQS